MKEVNLADYLVRSCTLAMDPVLRPIVVVFIPNSRGERAKSTVDLEISANLKVERSELNKNN